MWVQGRLTKKHAPTRPGHIWPEDRSRIPNNSQRADIEKGAEEKPDLDAERRGIYFSPNIVLKKEKIVNKTRRKLEIRSASAMPSKVTEPSRPERLKLEEDPVQVIGPKLKRKDSSHHDLCNRKEFDPHRVRRELTKTSSQIEVKFPCRHHIMAQQSSFHFKKHWKFQPAKNAMNKDLSEWRTKQLSLRGMVINTTTHLVDRTSAQFKTPQVKHDSSATNHTRNHNDRAQHPLHRIRIGLVPSKS